MRYLFLFLLGYIIYRYLKPLLQKGPENPHVKGSSPRDTNPVQERQDIEDAEFEEIE